MTKSKQTAYERLKELLIEADSATYSWTSSGKSTEWKQSVQSALRRLYGDKCEQLKAFNNIRYGLMIITGNTPDSDFQKAYMNGMTRAQAMLRSAIKEFEDYELQESNDLVNAAVINDSPNDGKHGRQIFVVHGHDNEMKQTVARFLERLGFEPIILHEHANAGDTIIEKFERHSDVTFAVVLLSPDDVGSASVDKKNLQPRARQNVVLELGYFIGRLGRSHVCALVRGQVEIPSDFHGVAYVPFEGDAWKLHVVKELKHLGYEIDANKVF